MKSFAVLFVVLVVGCGGLDAPVPLDEFCEQYAAALCDAEVLCDGIPTSCDRRPHINWCLAEWSCLVEVDFARACLDEINSWDCIAWPESCLREQC